MQNGKPTALAKVEEKQKVNLSGKDIEIEEPGVESSMDVEGDLEIARDVVGDEKMELEIERKTKLNFSETEVRQQWKEELHRRLKIHGGDCLSEWKWKTGEWGADNKLLKNIATTIGRDFARDVETKGSNLRRFMEEEINRYLKTGAYKY